MKGAFEMSGVSTRATADCCPVSAVAEDPPLASELYEYFAGQLSQAGISVAKGRFGAHMQVELLNDGPVTFILQATNGALTSA